MEKEYRRVGGKKLSWAAACLVALLVVSCAGQDAVTKHVEAPAAAEPQLWLGALLEEEPTVASGLFRVVDEKVIERDGIEVGQATVEFDYLDIHGQPAEAQANLFVERSAVENGGKTPLATFVHYESSPDGSVGWCRRGWAMLTPHLNPQHALGNSFNLDLAMIEWGRRLPFVDRQHLAIVGGSAGGYMALAMSAEVFPVAATVADAPVINWAYNAAFLVKNLDLAKGTAESPLEWQKAPLPVMLAVSPIALDAQKLFGGDLASDTWYKLSPISYYPRVTSPASLAISTADMLVPMPQFSRDHYVAPDPAEFPDGFEMGLEPLTEEQNSRRPFLDLLSQGSYSVFVEKIPRDLLVLDIETVMGSQGKKMPPQKLKIDRQWDTGKQWTVTVFDEGAPHPKIGHLKYRFDQNANSFLAHYRDRPLQLDQLTLPKLERLAERFSGTLSDTPPLVSESGEAGDPVHRLNFPALEKLDVVTGLLDYAGCGAGFEARLKQLYAELPAHLRVWGDPIDLNALQTMRDNLRQQARQVKPQ